MPPGMKKPGRGRAWVNGLNRQSPVKTPTAHWLPGGAMDEQGPYHDGTSHSDRAVPFPGLAAVALTATFALPELW